MHIYILIQKWLAEGDPLSGRASLKFKTSGGLLHRERAAPKGRASLKFKKAPTWGFFKFERVGGIEPPSSAWKADIRNHYTIPAYSSVSNCSTIKQISPDVKKNQCALASLRRPVNESVWIFSAATPISSTTFFMAFEKSGEPTI